MISRISGPIPTHEMYMPSQQRNTPDVLAWVNGSVAPRTMDPFQWDKNLTFNRTQSYQNRRSVKKNYIQENIRRTKLQQEMQRQATCSPTVRRVPYFAAFVPVDDSTKSTTEEKVQAALPPKPCATTSKHTAVCRGCRTSRIKSSTSDTDSTMAEGGTQRYQEKCIEFHGRKRFTNSSEDSIPYMHSPIAGKAANNEQLVCPSCSNSPDLREAKRQPHGVRPLKRSRVRCRATQCSNVQLNHSSRGVQTDVGVSRIEAKQSTSDPDVSGNDCCEPADQDLVFNFNPNLQGRSFSVERRPSHLNTRRTTPNHDFMRAHTKGLGKVQELQNLSKVPIRRVSRSPRPDQLTVPKASIAKKLLHLAGLTPHGLDVACGPLSTPSTLGIPA